MEIKDDDIIIEYAQIADSKTIQKLEKDWASEGEDYDMNPYTLKQIEQAILDKRIILAEYKPKAVILGFLFFEIEKERDICELDAIYLRKDYRNQNIGQMLVRYFLNIPRVKACKRISLLADSVHEDKLIKFYEKFGFKRVAVKMLKKK